MLSTRARSSPKLAPVHGSFDQFQAVHVPFDRTIAPGVLESCSDGGFIPAEVLSEGSERTLGGRIAPLRECAQITHANDAEELSRDICGEGDVR